MKIKNRKTATLTMMVFAICLSANIFGQTRIDQPIEAALFGMHSLSPGQTAQLSVVNSQPASNGEIIPCIRVRMLFDIYETGASETARQRFLRRVEREELLDPGEAVSFNFPAARACDGSVRMCDGSVRVSVSVFVYKMNEADSTEAIRRATISTLSVLEGSRTAFTLPGIIKGFDPQPDPPVLTAN